MLNVKGSVRSGTVVLTLAILLAPLGYFLFRKDVPDALRIEANSFQKNTGLSGDTLYDLRKVQIKMGKHEPISDAEWNYVDGASRSKALEFRVNSLQGLPALEETSYRNRAHEVMRRLANDTDPATAALALTLLVETHDEQAPKLFAMAKKNPAPIMQSQVAMLAKKWKLE